jgi:hypothetical protein
MRQTVAQSPAVGLRAAPAVTDGQLTRDASGPNENNPPTTQLSEWAEPGLRAVRIKIGAEPALEIPSLQASRQAIGDAAL